MSFNHKIPILTYHSIMDGDEQSVSVKSFKKQMCLMKKMGYQTIKFNELDNDNSKKKFIITFDDGYENIFLNALPILKQLNFTAICFFVVNKIGHYNEWDADNPNYKMIKLMNFEQINEWLLSGFDIGSHTMDHLNLKKLNYEEKIKQIIKPIKIFNDKFNIKIDSFAYPFGSYDDESINIVKENYDQFPHFIIVPEIFQMWDDTWQEIVGSEYKDVPNDEWHTSDIFDIRASKKYRERMALIKDPSEKDIVELRVVKKFLKWTGWFDLYSKDLYEKIIAPPKEWKGYGPWDLFSMNIVADLYNDHNFKFLEFVITEKIGKYSTGPLNQKKGPHTGHWIQPSIKKFLHTKENNSKEEQRQRKTLR